MEIHCLWRFNLLNYLDNLEGDLEYTVCSYLQISLAVLSILFRKEGFVIKYI